MGEIQTMNCECEVCRVQTVHDVVARVEDEYEIDEPEMRDIYCRSMRIIRCRGCQNPSFAEISSSTALVNTQGELIETVTLYPARARLGRQMLDELGLLPKVIRNAYRETIVAFNASCRLLVGIGVRLIVEAICQQEGCTARNLEGGIGLLAQKGFVTDAQADLLHLQRFLGNISAHELTPATDEELIAAIETVEAMLRLAYIVPERIGRMVKSKAELAKIKQKARKTIQ